MSVTYRRIYQSENGIWQMEVERADGKVVWWSLRTRDQAVAKTKAAEYRARKRKGKRLERLRELTFSPADADLCWMLVRATALSAAVQEALFEQPLRTRDDRALALEITLEAIEHEPRH